MQCDLQLSFIHCILKFQCDEKQDTDCKASLCACDIEFVNTIRQFQHKFDKGQNQNNLSVYPNYPDILGYTVQNGFNRNESCQIQPMPSRPAKEPNRGGNGEMAPPRFQKDPTGSFKGLTTRDHLIFGNKRECCGSYPKELSLSST